MGAGLKSMFGGELKGMTKALYESRNETMSRMIEEATQPRRQRHRRRCASTPSELGEVWTEICAYGTAVRATKL